MDTNMNKIYVIMCCTKLEQDVDIKFPDFGSEAIMGWFKDKDYAFRAVTNNYADIHETIYDYVIIEEVEEGLYPASITRWFFKWNPDTQGYIQIEEPNFCKNFCGLVIS